MATTARRLSRTDGRGRPPGPETTLDIITSLRTQLSEFGLDKPIWINETNAPPFDDPAQSWEAPVFRVTQSEQAAFLLQEFAFALSLGVDRIGVYKWVDEPRPQAGSPSSRTRSPSPSAHPPRPQRASRSA